MQSHSEVDPLKVENVQLMNIAKEFECRTTTLFHLLPIKISCYSTANDGQTKYPINFDFFLYYLYKRSYYAREIRGTIYICHQSENVHIIPQTIHIECYHHILSLTSTDMKRISRHPGPILSHSE